MPGWVNIPNFFTLLRLLLVPFVIAAIIESHPVRALILFACAALTDLLDGASARQLGLITKTGAYLDPIADKCLLSGVFVALAVARLAPRWLVVLILGRDIYILLAAGILLGSTRLRSFPPSFWGKASTFVQIVTAVLWMARDAFRVPVLDGLSMAILWLCAVLTVWSGAHYTWRGIHLLRID